MEEITIRGTKAQRNLMEWSQRVADCRSSGLSVTRWCAEHSIKPKTYYNWQKKRVSQVRGASSAGRRKAADHSREANGSGRQRPNRRRLPGGLRRRQRGDRFGAM